MDFYQDFFQKRTDIQVLNSQKYLNHSEKSFSEKSIVFTMAFTISKAQNPRGFWTFGPCQSPHLRSREPQRVPERNHDWKPWPMKMDPDLAQKNLCFAIAN